MERIRRHISYANVAATLALVFAMSGGAIAATGGFSSGGTLHACANEEGAIRLLKAGKSCKKGQKAVTWNQTGPAGAKGAAGAAGAPGPAGASGTAGVRGDPGTAGTSASIEWARVKSNGEIVASEGVTGVEGTTSPYVVAFGRPVNECAVTATNNQIEPKDKVTAAESNRTSTIRVHIRNDAEADVPAEFSITAVCP
jgi:hypothetical protein